jgi:hypothetical protein
MHEEVGSIDLVRTVSQIAFATIRIILSPVDRVSHLWIAETDTRSHLLYVCESSVVRMATSLKFPQEKIESSQSGDVVTSGGMPEFLTLHCCVPHYRCRVTATAAATGITVRMTVTTTLPAFSLTLCLPS